MYDWTPLKGNSFVIDCPSKIGVVRTDDGHACLIDSGNDKSAARKTKALLDEHGLAVDAIFNTHSHADHIGGNRTWQTQTGCAVYAPPMECDFVRHPVYEPTFLYGGFPPQALRHKFLMAPESDAVLLTEEVLPEGWRLLPLPGHSLNMTGFLTPDRVAYIADSLSSTSTLQKYGIGVIHDVAAYLQTLETLKTLDADLFVPSHAAVTDDIAPLADINAAQVHRIAEVIVSLCAAPHGFDELLASLFETFGLQMSMEQYVLVGSTVRSYLAWLVDTGALAFVPEPTALRWVRK